MHDSGSSILLRIKSKMLLHCSMFLLSTLSTKSFFGYRYSDLLWFNCEINYTSFAKNRPRYCSAEPFLAHSISPQASATRTVNWSRCLWTVPSVFACMIVTWRKIQGSAPLKSSVFLYTTKTNEGERITNAKACYLNITHGRHCQMRPQFAQFVTVA